MYGYVYGSHKAPPWVSWNLATMDEGHYRVINWVYAARLKIDTPRGLGYEMTLPTLGHLYSHFLDRFTSG